MGYDIEFVSDPDFELLVAEISINGQIVCILDVDDGVDNLNIEFIEDKRLINLHAPIKIRLNSFLEAIQTAKKELCDISLKQ